METEPDQDASNSSLSIAPKNAGVLLQTRVRLQAVAGWTLHCTHFSLEIFEGEGVSGGVCWVVCRELESCDIFLLFWFSCNPKVTVRGPWQWAQSHLRNWARVPPEEPCALAPLSPSGHGHSSQPCPHERLRLFASLLFKLAQPVKLIVRTTSPFIPVSLVHLGFLMNQDAGSNHCLFSLFWQKVPVRAFKESMACLFKHSALMSPHYCSEQFSHLLRCASIFFSRSHIISKKWMKWVKV